MGPIKAMRITLVLFALLVTIEADGKSKGTDNNGKNKSGVTETKGNENGKESSTPGSGSEQCLVEGHYCNPKKDDECCDDMSCYTTKGQIKFSICRHMGKTHKRKFTGCHNELENCSDNGKCCGFLACHSFQSDDKRICKRKNGGGNGGFLTQEPGYDEYCIKNDESCHISERECCKGLSCQYVSHGVDKCRKK